MSERLIVIHRGSDYVQDFEDIAQRICAIDPGISVFCIDKSTSRVMPDSGWRRPTLTVALQSGFNADIKRGSILKKPAVLALGVRVGQAFPAIPILGIDIIQG